MLSRKLILDPNLLAPRLKPSGHCAIDWSHPLAQKLKRCLIFNNKVGKRVLDLARNAVVGQPDPTASQVPTWNADYISGDNSETQGFYVGSDTIFTGNRTVMVVARRHGTATVAGQICAIDSANNNDRTFQLRTTTADKLQFISFNTTGSFSSVIGATTIPVNTWFTGCGVHAGTAVSVFLNGKSDQTPGSVAGTPSVDAGGFGVLNRFNVTGSPEAETDEGFYGDVKCVYLWDRALSSGEVLSMHLNPYQFLIPAGRIDPLLYIPSAGNPDVTYKYVLSIS